MLHCYHPNTQLNGPPIGASRAGVPKPVPADLVLSTDNPAVAFHGPPVDNPDAPDINEPAYVEAP
jgi:hypothetical protein